MIPSDITQISLEMFESGDAEARSAVEHRIGQKLVSLCPASARLISVDGWTGVGKSTIGALLAGQLGAALVDLDDHLVKNQGGFLDHLKLPELEAAIRTGLKEQGSVVVTGCILDLALERIGIPADLRLYVMRTSGMIAVPDAESIDEYEALYGEKSADELIVERADSTRKWAAYSQKPLGPDEDPVGGLSRELIRYHRQQRPHDRADAIVKVVRRGS